MCSAYHKIEKNPAFRQLHRLVLLANEDSTQVKMFDVNVESLNSCLITGITTEVHIFL